MDKITAGKSMSVGEILQWQWNGYAQFHQSRANLYMHIIAVPLFLLANISLLVAMAQLSFVAAILSVIVMAVSMAVQGKGHKKEEHPAIPFSSPMNAITRIFLEQWITFPRFVISGGWLKALRAC
ncbi:terminase [Undibacterium sp. Di27W]|uniref:terminase n=1 Tax=Undibacterium sp. Di27W TaxID=3413036 RepID=UPI003BF39DA2